MDKLEWPADGFGFFIRIICTSMIRAGEDRSGFMPAASHDSPESRK